MKIWDKFVVIWGNFLKQNYSNQKRDREAKKLMQGRWRIVEENKFLGQKRQDIYFGKI